MGHTENKDIEKTQKKIDKEYYDKVRNYLFYNLKKEANFYYGMKDIKYLNDVTNEWMNDEKTSKPRYDLIKNFFKLKKGDKILDMASGCGTFVFYGLVNGYDVHGIDPEDWKNKLNMMKIKLYHYPEKWSENFIKAYGEKLPFEDESFDVVSSYQTLEHVGNVDACLSEMVRVLKKGGMLLLQYPDYSSTFEGHYMMMWIPLFPRILARFYLNLRGKPVNGLNGLNYVTKRNVLRYLRKAFPELKIIDYDRIVFLRRNNKILDLLKLKRKSKLCKAIAMVLNVGFCFVFVNPKNIIIRQGKGGKFLIYKPVS